MLSQLPSGEDFEQTLCDVLAWQRETVAPYRRFCDSFRGRELALPTDVFRHARVASHEESRDKRMFQTSGTTASRPGRHYFADLRLYDLAARYAAKYALFPDVDRMRLVILAPHPDQQPHSSLSYMLGRFEEWFGLACDWCWNENGPLVDTFQKTLHSAMQDNEPICLLGTSFAFAILENSLADQNFSLPSGSRLMQTGGFKGKVQEVDPGELRTDLCLRYGIDRDFSVMEYGMTELTSQLYEVSIRHAALGEPRARGYWAPPWTRARVVDPMTQKDLPEGELGAVRIDDAANVNSVASILTSDLGIVRNGYLMLHGRARSSTIRGCSLSVEDFFQVETS